MADLTKMSPKSGRIIAEDGTVKNLVDLLGGGTPVGDEVYPLEKMSPSSGRVIGENGKIYNVVDLLEGIEDEIKDVYTKDESDARYLQKSGGVVTGQITTNQTEFTASNQLISKGYVDTIVGDINTVLEEVL